MQVQTSDLNRLANLCYNAEATLNEIRQLVRDLDFASGYELFTATESVLVAETMPTLMQAFNQTVHKKIEEQQKTKA